MEQFPSKYVKLMDCGNGNQSNIVVVAHKWITTPQMMVTLFA